MVGDHGESMFVMIKSEDVASNVNVWVYFHVRIAVERDELE